MAISALTPRDRLQRIIDLGRKTMRYWWLIAIFAVIGGVLSMGFAMSRPKKFQSWSTIFYQERIQSSLLSPGRDEAMQRNIGDKYRELLLARAQLSQIVADPALNPFPDEPDPDVAIDKLRNLVKLEARGGNAFRINYTDAEQDRAQAVAAKLTKLLQEMDERLRNQQAGETVGFANKQKDEATVKLREVMEQLNTFLSKHPEFAADPNTAQSEGASIRARQNAQQKGPQTPEEARLLTLERQRQRIQARLDAPPDAPPMRIASPKSPERLAAEAAVGEAQREVAAAKRELEDAQSKYMQKHPSVIKAQDRVDIAMQRLRQAQGSVPPEIEETVVPATPEARKGLEKTRNDLDAQIARLRNAKPGTAANDTTSWIVQLETEHAELRRSVQEQRERVNSLAEAVYRAEIDANIKLAETGGRLSVVDPAFRPVKPSGPGKKIFLMAGIVVFMGLGFGLAVMLAVIDDRLYRRSDLEYLGVAVLGVIPPAPKAPKAPKAPRTARAAKVAKLKAPKAAGRLRAPTEAPPPAKESA